MSQETMTVDELDEIVSAVEEEEKLPLQEKRIKIFGVELTYLCFLGICVAFIGWWAENIVRIITRGIFDSRVHIFPFMPVYALVVFAVHIVFGNPDDLHLFGRQIFKEKKPNTIIFSNLVCWAIMCGFVFVGEFVVGNLWDILLGLELWDYSEMPLSITQYAGLIPSLGYGTGAWLLTKFAICPAIKLLQEKANYKVIFTITCILSAMLFADELAMFLQFIVLKEAPVYWQIILPWAT